ncbi:MAG: hypothetical protein QGG71_26600, partial [Pirellulaceae bacterium]|nr:hypothetical protein [Pirellulaceae bacterium]
MKSTPQNTDRQPELIPAKLRELTQWVVWKTVDKGGRPTKVPYQTSGYEAKSNDRDTWTEFNAAVAVVERFEGVGFVFSAADDLCGIDLDACRDPLSGRIAPWATYWIDKFNSYTEVSPSESGVKIFVQGKNPRPRGKNRRVDEDAITDKPPGVEIYDKVRFFTVTAQRHENVSPNVEPRQDVIDEFLATYFPLKETATANHNGNGKATGNGKAPSNIADRAAKYVGKMPEAIDGQGGHTATFEVAAVLKRGFSLSDNDAWRILCRYNDRCKPPWSEHDLRRKMDEGAKADRDAGYLLNDSSSASSVSSASEAPEDVVTNAIVKVGNGEEKPKKFPLRLNEIIARTRHQTGDWPRRMGNVLFIDDQQHGISFFDKSPQLFGWFAHKVGRVAWHGGPSSVKQPELFAEYQRTATSYLSVEPLPHEPPMPNRYYSGADIRAGDGSKLHELVDRFCPATDIDGDLILAAFLTPGWGGPAGCRPC